MPSYSASWYSRAMLAFAGVCDVKLLRRSSWADCHGWANGGD